MQFLFDAGHINAQAINATQETPRRYSAFYAAAIRIKEQSLRANANNTRTIGNVRRCKCAQRRNDFATLGLRVQFIQVAEEARGKEGFRTEVEILRCARLHNLALAHQRNTIGNMHGLFRIMRHDNG